MEKIRVLHVLNTLCVGGIETSVINICNNIDKTKYEVYLLVLTSDKNELLDRLDGIVTVKILNCKYYDRSFNNIFNLLLNILNIKKYIKNNNIDIIHTHIYQYNILPILLLIKMFFTNRIRHYHTTHTTGLHYQKKCFKHVVKLNIESFFYKILRTNIIAVSEEVKRVLVENIYGYKNLRVITNSVDLVKFKRKCKRYNLDEQYNLVYVSRLVEGKNHITLINALELVLKEKSNIHLYLVGDGKMKNFLIELVLKKQISDNVHFLGNVDNVIEVLENCDIGVFPSEYEGFSVALIEMMALELAIVCSSIQNFKDIFRNSDDALFFDVFDHVQLARNLLYILNNKSILLHFKGRSVSLAELYSTSKVVDELQLYYQLSSGYEKV